MLTFIYAEIIDYPLLSMKKLLHLILVFCINILVPSMGNSQLDFFPPEATWYYAFGPGQINIEGYRELHRFSEVVYRIE